MKTYFVDVKDKSNQVVQKFMIYAGSRQLPGNQSVCSWIVRVTNANPGFYELYINGPELITLDTNKSIGTLIRFDLNSLVVGSSFQIQYVTGTYDAVVTEVKSTPDPKPNLPKNQNTPTAPVFNPNMPDVTQPVIDYVNQQNQ